MVLVLSLFIGHGSGRKLGEVVQPRVQDKTDRELGVQPSYFTDNEASEGASTGGNQVSEVASTGGNQVSEGASTGDSQVRDRPVNIVHEYSRIFKRKREIRGSDISSVPVTAVDSKTLMDISRNRASRDGDRVSPRGDRASPNGDRASPNGVLGDAPAPRSDGVEVYMHVDENDATLIETHEVWTYLYSLHLT